MPETASLQVAQAPQSVATTLLVAAEIMVKAGGTDVTLSGIVDTRVDASLFQSVRMVSPAAAKS